MNPRIEYPYECQVKGHSSGSRIFTSAPPDWFASKGLSTPRNCPACREWIKSQTEEVVICACGTPIRVTANKKISHFKHTGPYEPVTQCAGCARGNTDTEGMKARRRPKEQKEAKRHGFHSLLIGTMPSEKVVVTDLRHYRSVKIRNGKINAPDPKRQIETRATHLEHHIPGSPNSWTDSRSCAGARGTSISSATSFIASGTVGDLLEIVSQYAMSTDTGIVRQYQSDTNPNRVMLCSFTGEHNGIELTILERLENDVWEVVTSYDGIRFDWIKSRPWYPER